MWQSDPTPEHHCDFPWGEPLRRADVQPIWKCEGCGMEFDVRIADWHFWWSPEITDDTEYIRKPGASYDTALCTKERLCIIFPRVEFSSRGKMPNGYTLGTFVDLHPDDIGERPDWVPDFPQGHLRDIAPAALAKDKELNILGGGPSKAKTPPGRKVRKKRKWLLQG